MNTVVRKIDFDNDNSEIFLEAKRILEGNGLVAFPTETVYGLGANALSEVAVNKIYLAKGRPSDNPLIVHVHNIDAVQKLAKYIPQKALLLADAFWPGPLTMIFKKTELVPAKTSGGLDTVAIRIPENETALQLLMTANLPIAAPSANISGSPSPTNANRVFSDLNNKIDMIIDGGSCLLGLESTIIDMTEDTPALLRPGSITIPMIEEIIGSINIDHAISLDSTSYDLKPKAPGMKYRHYSPKAKITIVTGDFGYVQDKIKTLIASSNSKKIGILGTSRSRGAYEDLDAIFLSLGNHDNPRDIGSNLFENLRKFDDFAVDEIFAEGFNEDGDFLAIMNRLKKAAGFNII